MPFDPLSASPTKWSNKLKKNHRQEPTNCLSVFEHFVDLALKGLNDFAKSSIVDVWQSPKHVSVYGGLLDHVPEATTGGVL